MDKYYVYRPMLKLIGRSEGTAKKGGYEETLGYGIMLDGKVSHGEGQEIILTNKNLRQIDKIQTQMLKDPDNKKLNSSALGMYQIVRTTIREIKKDLDLDPMALFNADMQDRMACYLLGLRGIDKYLGGRLKEDTLINNLAREWASLPQTNGKGAYGGQNASVSVADVRKALAEVRKRATEASPEIVVVPVEPGTPPADPQVVQPVTPPAPVVVTEPVKDNPPAAPQVPSTKKGWGVLLAILAAGVAAIIRYFGG